MEEYNEKWDVIAELFPDRSDVQCQQRWTKVVNPELVKGPWTKEVSVTRFEITPRPPALIGILRASGKNSLMTRYFLFVFWWAYLHRLLTENCFSSYYVLCNECVEVTHTKGHCPSSVHGGNRYSEKFYRRVSSLLSWISRHAWAHREKRGERQTLQLGGK